MSPLSTPCGQNELKVPAPLDEARSGRQSCARSTQRFHTEEEKPVNYCQVKSVQNPHL